MILICGPKGRVTASGLSDTDKKTVENFAEFMRGEGTRCPHCLHKAKKHRRGASRQECWGDHGKCECRAGADWIRRWWEKRMGE